MHLGGIPLMSVAKACVRHSRYMSFCLLLQKLKVKN
uniref:Uncharacterized protein n=1 Tax=Anguilla anguilla TaxID=7936 RepID=A0A0E9QIS1_ANGAN